MATPKGDRPRSLSGLVSQLERSSVFSAVSKLITKQNRAIIEGAWGSSYALLISAFQQKRSSPILVITPTISIAEDFYDDLQSFRKDEALLFPAWEVAPQKSSERTDTVFNRRLQVLNTLESQTQPNVVLASIPALLLPVPTRKSRREAIKQIKVGETLEVERLMKQFVGLGWERVRAVSRTGEFSMHGGILDLFSPGQGVPFRIELFGDEVDSMRSFDPETQSKLEEIESIELQLLSFSENNESPQSRDCEGAGELQALTPALSQGERERNEKGTECFLDGLPANTHIVLIRPEELIEEGKSYLDRIGDVRGLYGVATIFQKAERFPSIQISGLSAQGERADVRWNTQSIERFTGPRSQVLEELQEFVDRDERVLIACHNEGEQKRLSEMLEETAPQLKKRVDLCLGRVREGFRLFDEHLVVIGDHQLFRRQDFQQVRQKKRRTTSRAIDSFLELKKGDLIVHLSHGIGRFRGIRLLEKDRQQEEHLVLEFRDKVMLYVPTSLIHLVQKYIGASKSAPSLSKIGGTSWEKKKQRVSAAVADMAADMIRLQAAREANPGFAFPPDSNWQREFDAAFPYVETQDQLDAIDDIKNDMEHVRPMDRLICGDVGYGKTEVAMRAVFKCVEAGKQAAVLVPTTVLAEQHFRTFSERMAEYPISIEVLSRFRTKKRQREILQDLQEGKVDIAIGTHRLVQKDVKFKELGLLVIDEEQRFGVEAKETLKKLRLEIEVLTLSATPIPRTLHLSLLGIRDISNLTIAPQERQAVRTQLSRFDPELIRRAMIRELNRSGQVYFVHNRIYNIETMADRIRSIVPEARVDVGHGQMPEGHLEDVMYRFVAGEIDVLVCTTIIESGLDIPNANTIFIHMANIYGLSDLHQLRGRVGRYRHKAYCYLMLEENKPVSPDATRRLKAIEEFSELGAGFKIAMRDLEIRGAGNILGTQQSGHISAVGYDLYCQLLEKAVGRLKDQPVKMQRHAAIDLPFSAFFPEEYVPSPRTKVDLYRVLSGIGSLEELQDFTNDLRDRFGKIPEETARLLEQKEIEIAAVFWGIDEIRIEDGDLAFKYRNQDKIEHLVKIVGSNLRIADKKSAYFILSVDDRQPENLLNRLKSVLQLS